MNDWAIGGTAPRAPYFSIDRGQTVFNGNALHVHGPHQTATAARRASGRTILRRPVAQLGMLDPTVAYGR
jgi:hypothetical protein